MHLLRALQLVVDSLHIALHSADLIGLVRERFCRGQRNLLRLLQQLQRVLGSIDRFSLCLQRESKEGIAPVTRAGSACHLLQHLHSLFNDTPAGNQLGPPSRSFLSMDWNWNFRSDWRTLIRSAKAAFF